MATYSTIKGFNIKSLASDPYTSSIAAGTWASGGAVNAKRAGGPGAGVTSSAGLFFGGDPGGLLLCESYDGTSWTEGNNMNTDTSFTGGSGPQGAAITMAGMPYSNKTELYDGTCWTTSPATLNTGRSNNATCGTQTAALCIAGRISTAHANTNIVEDFDGSTWTEVNDVNTTRRNLSASPSGTPSAALGAGGYITAASALTESYDGTSWTEVGDLNLAKDWAGMAGNQTSAIFFAGRPTMPPGYYQTTTEYWDGSTWTEINDLGTGRYAPGFGGSSSGASAFCASGGPVAPVGLISEEFSVPSTVTVAQEGQVWYNTTSTVLKGFAAAVSTGAWASGADLNIGRAYMCGAGTTQNTALVSGGQAPAPQGGKTDITETYNGSAWTEVGDLLAVHTGAMGAGTQTAAFCAGGFQPGDIANMEIWDGTSWTEVNNINTARRFGGGAGTTTSGLVFSGGATTGPTTPHNDLTESWDGTCWTEVADLANAHQTNVGGLGTLGTAALCIGGYKSPAAATAFVEEWNGTAWSELTAIGTAGYYIAGNGTTTSALCYGGGTSAPTILAKTQFWNGSAWAELTDLGTARYSASGSHNSPSSEATCAGGNPAFMVTTEEWTATGKAIQTFTAT